MLPHRLGLLHEEVQNLRDRRSEALLLEDTQDLDASDQLYLWHTEAVPQRDINDEGVILFYANLPICSLRSSGFSLIQLGARRLYGSVAKICPCPVHTCVLPNWASTNETEQTAANSNNITANVGPTQKNRPEKETSSKGAANISLNKPANGGHQDRLGHAHKLMPRNLQSRGEHTVPVIMATIVSTKDNGKRSECRL